MLELELTPEFEPREFSAPAKIETVVYEGGGVSEGLKTALLSMAEKVAYIDANGQSYYDDLYRALYPLAILTAVFAQEDNVIYNTDSLDSLRPMLTVTAMYSDDTSSIVTDYTLFGNLTEGTSTITVSYGGKTTTFDVTVTAVPGVFSVANTLVGCTNSNDATTATENTAYSGTLTADSGYTLTGAVVSITMGGVDITSTAYNNGAISIATVTGDIAISVTAVPVVLSSISAVFTQGNTVVYDTDSLDSLKSMLVVTATYSDSSTGVVDAADYTLTGTLAEGTSTVTVSYGGKTDTFSASVSAGVPTGYTKYDYIYPIPENTSGKISNTNILFLPLTGDKQNMQYNFSYKATADLGNVRCMIGGRDISGASDALGFYALANDSAFRIMACGATDLDFFTLTPNIVHEVSYIGGSSPTISVDGNTAANVPVTAVTEVSASLGLFSNQVNGSGDAYSSSNLQLGRIKIYSMSGALLADYVPSVRTSDGYVGMYDRVSKTFTGKTSARYGTGNWS